MCTTLCKSVSFDDGKEREEREEGCVWETGRESLAMAESIDAVSLDMEKIYLGGKVRPLTSRLDFYSFLCVGFVVFSLLH